MAKDAKATDAAKELADELQVDLAKVEGSGSEGQVTKPDVEAALADPAALSEELYYVELHEGVGLMSPTGGVLVGERLFHPGSENPLNVVSKSEWEEKYKGLLGAPSPSYPEGTPLLKKGGKV